MHVHAEHRTAHDRTPLSCLCACHSFTAAGQTSPACCAAVMQFMALEGLLDGKVKIRPMNLPDRFIEHGSQNDQMAEAGLTAAHVAATAASVLGRSKDVAVLEMSNHL